jgi:hypothetical protein
MADEIFALTYLGGTADQNRLDFYDASISYEGLARTLSILGHYYATGEIISKAPFARVELYLLPPEPGSFKQQVLIGITAAVLSVPFVTFTQAAMESWFPKNDPQQAEIIALLQEQNELLRATASPEQLAKAQADHLAATQYVKVRRNEIDVIRSITSNSFQKIFRPVGRSVDAVVLTGGRDKPVGVVTPISLAMIASDQRDGNRVTVNATVSAFSRNSKTGVAFSEQLGRGFRIEYMGLEKLKKEDIFSWSQFTQRPLILNGEFVYFFDGTIKKLLVYHAEALIEKDLD